MYMTIGHASFVKIMSGCFRKSTLLFRRWANGSNASIITELKMDPATQNL